MAIPYITAKAKREIEAKRISARAQLHVIRRRFKYEDEAWEWFEELKAQHPHHVTLPSWEDGWYVIEFSFNKDAVLTPDIPVQQAAFKRSSKIDREAAQEGRALKKRPINANKIVMRYGKVPKQEKISKRMGYEGKAKRPSNPSGVTAG